MHRRITGVSEKAVCTGGRSGFQHTAVRQFCGERDLLGCPDGNGHSISGLDAVLFEKMDGASVRNLTIAGSNLTGNTQKGALANEIRNSTVEKIRVKDLVIENDAFQAGGLAGIYREA